MKTLEEIVIEMQRKHFGAPITRKQTDEHMDRMFDRLKNDKALARIVTPMATSIEIALGEAIKAGIPTPARIKTLEAVLARVVDDWERANNEFNDQLTEQPTK